jgi:hypothetical protein
MVPSSGLGLRVAVKCTVSPSAGASLDDSTSMYGVGSAAENAKPSEIDPS